MQYFNYNIGKNESITRWRVTDVRRTPFTSPEETFEAEVNMGEGYVQIEYPVRRHFLEEHDLNTIERYEGEYENVYFPFENTRVDFSTFIHTPHTIDINGETYLSVPEDGIYTFDVYTCGGIKLWVDGNEVLVFGPYTRNIASVTPLSLELEKGMHHLEIYADELAERDVFFYFEIRYLGDKVLTGSVPVEEDPAEIKRMESFLKSFHVKRGVFEAGELAICYDGSLIDEDTEIKLHISGEAIITGTLKTLDSFIARKNATETVIADVDDCSSGGYVFDFSVNVGRYVINRRTLFAIGSLKNCLVEAPADYRERQRIARKYIYGHGEENITRAMVRMYEDGKMDETSHKFIYNAINKIHTHADCSDFVLVPLLWSIMRQKEMYPDDMYQEIKDMVLDFRYWIDEPGNDVMWYFSENHAFLFHCSQYLAGHIFPDETFRLSGRKGSEQYRIGHDRLIHWFDNFNKYHLAEWNSATYLPVDFIGFFTLGEVAPDDDIRELARRAIDYTFDIISNNTFKGILSSSYGRCYEKTLKARTQIETNFLSWIAYGIGMLTGMNRSAALMALSSYQVPMKHDFVLGEGKALLVKAVQGISPVYTYLYRTDSYSMGTVNRFKCFQHGHQQHILDVSFGDKCRQFYVNHPGERTFSGENRPSYWAGNGTCPMVVQHKALSLMMFDIDPVELVHYIHTWSPLNDYDEYRTVGNFLFVRSGDSYIGTYFSNGFEITREGANTDKEVICQGLKHFVAVRCSDKHECGSFDEFINRMSAEEISYDLDAHNAFVRDFAYGVLSYDENETRLDGEILADTWTDSVTKENY